jgi:hypothetical protein
MRARGLAATRGGAVRALDPAGRSQNPRIPDMTEITAAACLVARALVPPAGGIRTPR